MDAWRITELSSDSVLAKYGVKERELIRSICGVPMNEVLYSKGEICCKSGDEETLELSIYTNASLQERLVSIPMSEIPKDE